MLVHLASDLWSITKLAQWHQRIGKPGAGPPAQAHVARMIAAESVAVAIEHVRTAYTLPDSRSTWFWIM